MRLDQGILQIKGDPTPYAIVAPSEDREWCVLWLQGWTSKIEKHFPRLQEMSKITGISFGMINYAGHGDHPVSLDDSSRSQQFNEVLFMYDKLKSMGYKKIIVVGTSFGGYMAAHLSAERELAGVILRVPAIYQDEEWELPYAKTERAQGPESARKFRENITAESKLDALSAIKNFKNTVYVVEHAKDSIVPKNVVKAYFDVAKRGNYLVVPGVDHSPEMMDEPQKYQDYIQQMIIDIIELVRKESRF